ncbi:MAG: rhombosortase [Pseudomonadota bacterium]
MHRSKRMQVQNKRSAPVITLTMCAALLALFCLPESAHTALVFDRMRLEAGYWYVLVSGHWMHIGWEHLLWNVSALAVMGTLLEQQSRSLLLSSVLAGTIAVNLLLLLDPSIPVRYCGLSGVLNTLMGAILYTLWRSTQSFVVIFIAGLWLAKIAIEVFLGDSLLTSTEWPPLATAHLAGALGLPLALVINRSITRNHYEHLVPSE